MKKYLYKDEVYTEEKLDLLYRYLVNDCLDENDLDEIMTYDEFIKNPGKYLEELSLEKQILMDLSSYLSGQDRQLEKEIIPILYFYFGYTEEDLEKAGICEAEDAEWLIKEYTEMEKEEVYKLAQSEIEKAGFEIGRMSNKDFNRLCYLLTSCDPCAMTDDFIRQHGLCI